MDESTADVVEIHGTDPATMEIIVKYMYSSKIELDTTNVQNLVQVRTFHIMCLVAIHLKTTSTINKIVPISFVRTTFFRHVTYSSSKV